MAAKEMLGSLRRLVKEQLKAKIEGELNEAAAVLRNIDESEAACHVMYALLILEPRMPIPESIAKELSVFGLKPTNRIMTPEEALDMEGTIEKAARAAAEAEGYVVQNAPSTNTRQ